jgi:hypothetical protein
MIFSKTEEQERSGNELFDKDFSIDLLNPNGKFDNAIG